MRRVIALLVAAFAVSSAAAAGPGRLPGVPAFKTCAAAGPYWPTQTLAVAGTTGWLACKEEARIQKLDLGHRRVVRSLPVGAQPIAVALGYSSLWVLDSSGTLDRISTATGRVVRRIDTGAANAYNVWIGAGSVWVAGDASSEMVRISPAANRVVVRIPVGDGPADIAFLGTSAYVIDHRDVTLFRIDLRTNRATKLATIQADAPERIAVLSGSLWITGRGTDLLRVDPQTGAVQSSSEIGAGGIDVVAAAGALWVPSRSAAVDRTGFPTMETLRKVSPAGMVSTVLRARGRVDVHGLVAAPGAVWLADNASGVLYRVPTG